MLARNPHYWGQRPWLDRVEFRVVPEDGTRVLQLLAGEVDRVTEALAATASDAEPVSPDHSLRARLLQTLGGVDRFAAFFEVLTRLFDLPVETIRKLLARIDAVAAAARAGPRRRPGPPCPPTPSPGPSAAVPSAWWPSPTRGSTTAR